MSERDYNLEISVKILLEKYHNEMTNEGAHFRSELKGWYNFLERKLNNVSEEIQGASKQGKESMVNQASLYKIHQIALLKL